MIYGEVLSTLYGQNNEVPFFTIPITINSFDYFVDNFSAIGLSMTE